MSNCNVKQANYNTSPVNSDLMHGLSSLIYDWTGKMKKYSDDFLNDVVNGTIDNFHQSIQKNNNVYMNALMNINQRRRQNILQNIGSDANYRGISDSIRPDILKPSYVDSNNYLDFVQKLPGLENQGSLATRINSWTPGEGPVNLYPDELGSLSASEMSLDLANGYKNTGEASFNVWDVNCETNSILYKTKALFQQQKINTLISRFGTGADLTSPIHYNGQVGSQYGESKGRNLLTKEAETQYNGGYSINGYKNPFCRAWTHHYKYDKLYKTMRPFTNTDNSDGRGGYKSTTNLTDINKWWQESSSDNIEGWRTDTSGYAKSVMADGMLNIAPMYDDNEGKKIHTRQCMFSIENLAWKDFNPYSFEKALSWEQRGPNGGRIMWFPPYGLTFNETVNANWQSHSFIGRGEDIYTYTNTSRTGSLSFYMIVDHPSIIDYVFGLHNKGSKDKLTDNDVHRYFAGCDKETLVKEAKSTPMTDEYTISDVTESVNIRTQTINGQPQEIKISCYFPNNYSGVDDNVSFKTTDTNKVDFVAYMLTGRQAGEGDYCSNYRYYFLDELSKDARGYEMVNDLSRKDDGDNFTINGIGNQKWYYRVDNEYKSQKAASLGTKDITTEKKNCDGVYSFKNFCLAGIGLAGNTTSQGYTTLFFAQEDIEQLKIYETLKDIKDGKVAIESVEIVGYSSNSGSSSNNEKLATNRAETLHKLVEEIIGKECKQQKIEIQTSTKPSNGDSGGGVNSENQKTNRRADITIKLKQNKISKTEGDNKVDFIEAGKKIIQGVEYTVYKLHGNETNNELWYDPKEHDKSETNPTRNFVKLNSTTDNDVKIIKQVSSREKELNTKRYDQEYYFLKKLSVTDNIVFKKLTQKLQYFDPAFHSMSPEGFNGRLTFLQQCMRQGDTIDTVTTNNVPNAKNLAFGRPPFCMLRIGDFYNQMIIINNLSINYDQNGVSWDLNSEGIGVQPLLAFVQLSITFIGGGDLGGAVRRLQNAMSFNYYANTRLYDNRADRIEVKYDSKTGKASIDNDASYAHTVERINEDEIKINKSMTYGRILRQV